MPRASLAGGLDAYRKRVADPKQRARILASVEDLLVRKLYLADQSPGKDAHTRQASKRIQIARAATTKPSRGRTLSRYSPPTKTGHVRNGAELLIELVGHGVTGINHTLEVQPGGDVDRVMTDPHTAIASDGSVFKFGVGNPHPRSYGCYPRVLGHYVRKRGVLKLENAIPQDDQPARQTTEFGTTVENWPPVRRRVTVFDPQSCHRQGHFLKPHQHSVGITHVLVHGRFVLRNGKMTGQLPGRPVSLQDEP
ncbi:MAG: hypothetical protein Ct9H300mP1_36810 [Planctomycetaceae bacterium]|nr:MAG: hypothetical protein Ct9H300mP1_36810 [Planctomycetaceae bacterium]